MVFTDKDIEHLIKNKKDPKHAKKEYNTLKKGIKHLKTTRPAKKTDGIIFFSKDKQNYYIKKGEEILKTKELIRFTPASGAASRMFKDLIWFINQPKSLEELKHTNKDVFNFITKFQKELKNYAFYDKLKINKNLKKTIKYLLEDLEYKNKPKAFLDFHKYSKDEIRESFEEHIVEGLKCGFRNFHFTFSPEHEKMAKIRIDNIIKKYSDHKFKITYCFQDLSTNTIALDMKTQKIVKKENGEPLLRMAGHGALLKNLNNAKKEFIFLKNIDNIAKESMQKITINNIKMNIGFIDEIKNQIFHVIKLLKEDQIEKYQVINFIENKLHIKLEENFKQNATKKQLYDILNRPIKLCQMVKNQGEPGGGPVWIIDKNGHEILTISEQVEVEDGKNNVHLKNGTHFNPVALTISTKDHNGNYFDLEKYSNWDRCFISNKSYEGKEIKALELPGLWNGGIEQFITLFIEAPIETFNPVKTIIDLLRNGHRV